MKLYGLDKETIYIIDKDISNIVNLELIKEDEIEVSILSKDSENVIEILKGEKAYIKYKEKHHFFRALGLYTQFRNLGEKNFDIKEKATIEFVGAMIDASRNAVYKVSEIKKMLVKMALMGYSRCMLYTEDTYELDGYEYFGYLRGKYTKKELKEIDEYAYSLGIEVIPCIQTLAHLKQTLKWEYANGMKDTQDVLLVDEEKTYKFIEAMMSTLRQVFRSGNCHIGMDEAFDLGRGEYIVKNGYESHQYLMIKHLNKVCEIAKKYNFKPMMWDDMFLRAGAPNGSYYDVNTVITDEIANNIPKEIGLVYWDYYTSEEEKYDRLFEIREQFNNKIIFAGGSWKWMGYAPTYSKTFSTTNAALKKCKERGINEVFVTTWGDDGAEAPLNVILLGLMLYSEHSYYSTVDNEWLNKRCEFLTGLSSNDFLTLEELDLIPTVKYPNLKEVNPSKYLIYQDILLGAFDKHIEGLDLKSYYKKLTSKYEEISTKTSDYNQMFKLFAKISDFLSIKSEIGIDLRKAYVARDNSELEDILNNDLPALSVKLEEFHNVFRKLWYSECKGQGFEVIDIRLGGIKERINSTIFRLNQYLNKDIEVIEELEEEILYFSNNINEESKVIPYIRYQHIATQNILSW
ncbi:beta-N-acetylhexosaminidase [Clostridium carnis]